MDVVETYTEHKKKITKPDSVDDAVDQFKTELEKKDDDLDDLIKIITQVYADCDRPQCTQILEEMGYNWEQIRKAYDYVETHLAVNSPKADD